jgi:tellurite resistance protein
MTASAEALAQIAPDAALEEVRKRITRTNLFKLYAWGAVGFVLWLAGSPFFLFWLAIVALAGIVVYRWDRDRRTARIFYDVDNDEIVGRLALCNAVGESLAKARSLWRVQSSNRTSQGKYHAGASTLIERHPTRCATGSIKGLDLNIEPWAITVGAQEFLLLPDRLLVREGKQLAAVPYEWLSAAHATTSFIEDGRVPSDAKAIGPTWRFVNKSGGPDLRFNNNRQLPVLEYGELTLRSASGLNTVLQASTPAATWHAANALQELGRMASAPSTDAQQVVQPFAAPPSGTVPMPAVPWPAAPSSGRPREFVPTPPTRSNRRFLGASEVLSVAGRNIARPLAFVASTTNGIEASTIVTSLQVGDARHAGPLPYWPSYSECNPHQRARYLNWMAGGRTDPDIDIGYVFIFFYGLEWRALRDGLDVEVAREEVLRLVALYGPRSSSFRSYAADLLVFTVLMHPNATGEQELERVLGPLLEGSANAAAVLTAWYFRHNLPLPGRYALMLAPTIEGAKRSVVAKRAEHELNHLFATRYREAFCNGLVLTAAKRELSLEYRPASSSWHRIGSRLAISIPDVLRKWSQFKPLVSIWNQCIEDLRRAARLKEKSDGELTAEAWAALPPELRAQYDHPDRDRWDDLVSAAPRLGAFHLVKCGELVRLVGTDPAEKATAAQLRRVTDAAAELGYAVEPDARAQRKGLRSGDEMLIWRSDDTSCPDSKLYGAAHTLLSLAMQVAMADGVLAEEEAYVVLSMLTNTFTLDETLRKRFVALQHLLARQPVRAASLAKKLQSTRTPAELAKIGRVLVSVATTDGVVTEQEHAALRSLYKALGLSAAELGAAMASAGARLASDEVVEVRPGSAGMPGEPIPARPRPRHAVELDQAAIAAIIADTRDVAAMLADVFDKESDDDESPPAAPPGPTTAGQDAAAPEVKTLAQCLDARYQGVLAELLTKPSLTREEVRALALKRNLMPGAILETINTWSEETFGDFLIDESDSWQIHSELLQRQSA